jgi:hypothetical protein
MSSELVVWRIAKNCFLPSEHRTNNSELRNEVSHGGMAEWLKAAVLKTASLKGDVGSNPTPSARKFAKQILLLTIYF